MDRGQPLTALPVQLSGLLLAADHRIPDAVALPFILSVLPYLAVELSAAALAEGVAIPTSVVGRLGRRHSAWRRAGRTSSSC